MSVVLDESGIPIDAGNAAELVIRLRTENERLKAELAEVIEKCREVCDAIAHDKHPMDVWTRESAGQAYDAIAALNENKENQS